MENNVDRTTKQEDSSLMRKIEKIRPERYEAIFDIKCRKHAIYKWLYLTPVKRIYIEKIMIILC